MKTNNQNDFTKRTQSQIASILISNGVAFKCENLGDGRTFYVNDSTLRTRLGIKKAGFIPAFFVSMHNYRHTCFDTMTI